MEVGGVARARAASRGRAVDSWFMVRPPVVVLVGPDSGASSPPSFAALCFLYGGYHIRINLAALQCETGAARALAVLAMLFRKQTSFPGGNLNPCFDRI